MSCPARQSCMRGRSRTSGPSGGSSSTGPVWSGRATTRPCVQGTTSLPRASSPTSGSTTPRTCCGRCRAWTTTARRSPPCTPIAPRRRWSRRRAARRRASAAAAALATAGPRAGRPRRRDRAEQRRLRGRRARRGRTGRHAVDVHARHGAPQRCSAASSRSSRSWRWSTGRCSGASPMDRIAALTTILAGLPTVRQVLFLDDMPLPDLGDRVGRPPRGPRAGGDGRRRAGRVAAAAVQPPAVRHVLLGHDRAAEGIVHGAGGTLLEHVKEHRLHGDLRAGRHARLPHDHRLDDVELAAVGAGRRRADRALRRSGARAGDALGARRRARRHRVRHQSRLPAAVPGRRLPPGRRGRPARPARGAVDRRGPARLAVRLGAPTPSGRCRCSRSRGGTDIIGCFVLGHPDLPVRRGRGQCRSLGLDVAAVDDDGRRARRQSASWSAAARSRPGRSASSATRTATRSTQAYFASTPASGRTAT